MPKKLVKHFSFPCQGNIWRILAAPQEGLLVLEIREGIDRQVSFAAVNFCENKVLWQHLQLPESWWVSAVHLYGDQLYLQTYPDSQTPQPNGLMRVDAQTGKVQWQLDEVGFLRLSLEGVIVYQPKEEILYQLADPDSGHILRMVPEAEVKQATLSPVTGIQYPIHYTEESSYFSPIVQFMQRKFNIQAHKAFDYREYNHFIIISYYIYSNNQYANFLLVLDQQANILLQELLADNLQGIGLDTFFIIENRLIFVKEKTELVIYEL